MNTLIQPLSIVFIAVSTVTLAATPIIVSTTSVALTALSSLSLAVLHSAPYFLAKLSIRVLLPTIGSSIRGLITWVSVGTAIILIDPTDFLIGGIDRVTALEYFVVAFFIFNFHTPLPLMLIPLMMLDDIEPLYFRKVQKSFFDFLKPVFDTISYYSNMLIDDSALAITRGDLIKKEWFIFFSDLGIAYITGLVQSIIFPGKGNPLKDKEFALHYFRLGAGREAKAVEIFNRFGHLPEFQKAYFEQGHQFLVRKEEMTCLIAKILDQDTAPIHTAHLGIDLTFRALLQSLKGEIPDDSSYMRHIYTANNPNMLEDIPEGEREPYVNWTSDLPKAIAALEDTTDFFLFCTEEVLTAKLDDEIKLNGFHYFSLIDFVVRSLFDRTLPNLDLLTNILWKALEIQGDKAIPPFCSKLLLKLGLHIMSRNPCRRRSFLQLKQVYTEALSGAKKHLTTFRKIARARELDQS